MLWDKLWGSRILCKILEVPYNDDEDDDGGKEEGHHQGTLIYPRHGNAAPVYINSQWSRALMWRSSNLVQSDRDNKREMEMLSDERFDERA